MYNSGFGSSRPALTATNIVDNSIHYFETYSHAERVLGKKAETLVSYHNSILFIDGDFYHIVVTDPKSPTLISVKS